MVTSSLYSSSRFAYVRQFSSHLCKYIRMSCMCTCCYRNDLRAHTSTASVHIQPTSVLFSSGHWTAMSCSLAIDSRNQLQRGKSLFPLPTEMWIANHCILQSGAVCFTWLVLFLFVVTPVDYCPCLWTGMCSFLVWTVTDAMSCHWVSVCCLLLAIGLICTHQRCSSVEPQLGKGVRLNELQTWLTFYVCTLFRCWIVCVCTSLPSLLATSRCLCMN